MRGASSYCFQSCSKALETQIASEDPPESLLRVSWESPESFLRISWKIPELRVSWEIPESFLRNFWAESLLKVSWEFPESSWAESLLKVSWEFPESSMRASWESFQSLCNGSDLRVSRQDHENFLTILSERTVYTRVSYFINTCISNITYIYSMHFFLTYANYTA